MRLVKLVGDSMTIHNLNSIEDISKKVKHERHWRLLMDSKDSDTAEKMFRKAFNSRFPPKKGIPSLVLDAWEFASHIDYRHGNIPSRIYLNHPLRVASIIIKEVPDASEEMCTIALLHNVLEVSAVSSIEISARFGHPVSLAIQALTVDRKRRDKKYLKEYYSHIEATSVACALIKVADKLDNIYMICFNPSSEVRTAYLDEIDEWVIPMASRVAPVLGIRMKEVSMVMRKLGFLKRDEEIEKLQLEVRG